MGLFSSKKVISVSSTAYNLAGDITERPNFLKTTVMGQIVGSTYDSDFTAGLQSAYVGGPGVRLRNFPAWAKRNNLENITGFTSSSLNTGDSINSLIIANEIPTSDNHNVTIQRALISHPDYSYWAEQYVLANKSSAYNTNWSASIDESTMTVTITYVDGSTDSFVISDYSVTSRYLFVYYNLTKGSESGDVTTGDTTILSSSESFPDMTNWEKYETVNIPKTATLNTTVTTDVSYSDGSTDSSTTNTSTETVSYSDTDNQYQKEEYKGQVQFLDYISITSEITTEHQIITGSVVTNDPLVNTTTETLSDGRTKTTKTTTVSQSIGYTRSWRDDTQEVTTKSWGSMKIFIYKENSGNGTLDAMFKGSTEYGEYVPFIPVRVWNKFISDSYLPDVYSVCKRSTKKALNTNFDDIVTQVADNKNIADIDFTYVIFGVSLNSIDNSAKLYLWNFFTALVNDAQNTMSSMNAWLEEVAEANSSLQTWGKWYAAQKDITNPLYGTKEPSTKAFPITPQQSVTISSGSNKDINLNFIISWSALAVDTGTGLAKDGASKGDIWFTTDSTNDYDSYLFNKGVIEGDTQSMAKVTLYYQTTSSTWSSISIWGLKHTNTIYGGKSVVIKAVDALADTEESGFIIPINTGIMNSMSLTPVTQMTTACAYLIFNCYTVKKIPWYKRGFFKIFIMIVAVIVIAVISIFTFGAGAVVGAGLLGTGFAVGTAIGLTGFMAALVTAVSNALTIMLIAKIVAKVGTIAFGKQIGAIIGAISSVVATFATGGGFSSNSFNILLGKLTDPITLGNIASTLGKDISSLVINGKIAGIEEKSQSLQESYNKTMEQIQDSYVTNLGINQGIDLADLSMMTQPEVPYYETSESFLSRTLLTGSDIAQISKNYVNNYVDLNNQVELT